MKLLLLCYITYLGRAYVPSSRHRRGASNSVDPRRHLSKQSIYRRSFGQTGLWISNLAQEWAMMNQDKDDTVSKDPAHHSPTMVGGQVESTGQGMHPTASNGASSYDQLAKDWAAMNADHSDARSSPVSAPVEINSRPEPIPPASPTTSSHSSYDSLAQQWAAMNADHEASLPMELSTPPTLPFQTTVPTVTSGAAPDYDTLAQQWAAINADHDTNTSTPSSTQSSVQFHVNEVAASAGVPSLDEMEKQVLGMLSKIRTREDEYQSSIQTLRDSYQQKEKQLQDRLDHLQRDYDAFASAAAQTSQDQVVLEHQVQQLAEQLDIQMALAQQESARANEYLALRTDLEQKLMNVQQEAESRIGAMAMEFEEERQQRLRELQEAEDRLSKLQEKSREDFVAAIERTRQEVARIESSYGQRLEEKDAALARVRDALKNADELLHAKDEKIASLESVNSDLRELVQGSWELLERVKEELGNI